jgi:DNA-binding MarR family transcriptional regulator
MEKHGLIIRVKLWHMPLRQAEIIFGVTHDKSDKEIGEALKNIDSKAEMGWFERATGPNVKTQGIFLTDKGIEIRKLVLKELNLDLNKE